MYLHLKDTYTIIPRLPREVKSQGTTFPGAPDSNTSKSHYPMSKAGSSVKRDDFQGIRTLHSNDFIH